MNSKSNLSISRHLHLRANAKFAPTLLFGLVPLLVVAVAMLVWERDLLWKVQQLNLFLYTSDFFKEQMVVPGGMLSWLGTFFTQFFFQPWLGVGLLCAWWWLLMWLTRRTFAIRASWSVLALVPVALLVVADMDAGYWLYVMKLRGYFFVATIGTTAAVALLWAFSRVPKTMLWRSMFVALTMIVGYPLMGIYALAATLLMGAWVWRPGNNRGAAALVTVVALVAAVAVPLMYYRYVFYQTSLANIYCAALPIYIFHEEYHQYYIPFYLLAAYYLAMTLFYRPTTDITAEKNMGKTAEKNSEKLSRWAAGWRNMALQGVAVVALAVVTGCFWFKDENFHRELSMQHCIERLDWVGALNEAMQQDDEPTRAVIMMRNLALSRVGRQGDDMYNFPGGSKKSKAPFTVMMSQVAGHLIYYNYGLLNECHRLCMEEAVETGWRAEHLQYMARCAMLNGERQVARKYLDLLGKTHYFGRWAKWLHPMLNNPKRMAEAPEMANIMHMMHYQNFFGSDNGFSEKYLMQLLAKHDSNDPLFQEQALLATLWTKDANQFWARFVNYVRQHPQDRIPRHIQEAAFLFSNLEHRENLEQAPFNQEVKQTYYAFMRALKECEGLPIEQVRERLYPAFGNTYYFEYFLMRGITIA